MGLLLVLKGHVFVFVEANRVLALSELELLLELPK
jgi:hypothetical protein